MRHGHIEPSSSNYMAQARECVAQAQVAHTARERVTLLEMAEAWAHLAEEAEEIGHLVDEARERGLLPHKSDMHWGRLLHHSSTATRSELLPDVPTVGDYVPGYEAPCLAH